MSHPFATGIDDRTGLPSYRSTADRLWPDADQVEGVGPFAFVVSRPDRTAVLLWLWADDMLDAYLAMAAAGDLSGITMHDLRRAEVSA